MSNECSRSSSSLTLVIKGKGTRLGVVTAYGSTVESMLIAYSVCPSKLHKL